MTAAQKTAPEKSATVLQIETLLLRIGPEPSVDSWTNGNGWVTCARVTRPDGKVARAYAEGASSRDMAERVCLAAAAVMAGGGT